MAQNHKKAIGIDVCRNFVNIVRLERNGTDIILTESRQVPLEKEISNSDTALAFKLLANTLKHMKLTAHLEHFPAGLCVCAWPELLQILKLPDTAPHAGIKFIQDEIRQYAVLPLKNVQTDYCVLPGNTSSENKRVLVGACQAERFSIAVKELEKIQIDVDLIEPAIISLIRACYKKTIKQEEHKNSIIILLRDDVINLCVFSGNKFDFLRTKKLDAVNSEDNPAIDTIAEQVDSILQFYELEKISQQNGWQIFINCCPDWSQSSQISEQLTKLLQRPKIEINAIGPEYTGITTNTSGVNDFSPVAAGAAMKLLDRNDSQISINLIPQEISEIRKSYKHFLMIINTAAVILMLLFLHIAHLSIKTTEARTEISKDSNPEKQADIQQLARIQEDVNSHTVQILKNINSLKEINNESTWNNWAYILVDISNRAPETVQVHNVNSRNPAAMKIEGISVNYAAVNEFVEKLAQSKFITSVQIADIKQNMQYGNGIVDYAINCVLAD
ncbi:MAG: Fimbrial assembly protein (PilN) [Planctomycetes bacterium ADurb.Bin401]|nr:MAG: Fimbrial assembly protein (PilN) [Planctomycetes bacterium ADurb.Bin401]